MLCLLLNAKSRQTIKVSCCCKTGLYKAVAKPESNQEQVYQQQHEAGRLISKAALGNVADKAWNTPCLIASQKTWLGTEVKLAMHVAMNLASVYADHNRG